MNLFQDFIEAHFSRVEARMPIVEKRESLDEAPSDDQVQAQDSLFGVLKEKAQ